MVLLHCKEAVASGDGEHLGLIQKQMLLYFSSVSGFNSYAIEMLISTIQNAVLLSAVESHQCKWAALANWKGGRNKNIEIDLLQENRNKGIKGLIHLMGQTRPRKPLTELAEQQECVKLLMYLKHMHHLEEGHLLTHTCRLPMMTQGLCCWQKVQPFSQIPGRSHKSFMGISSDPLKNLDEEKFCEWLKSHQKNIPVHFPTQSLDDSGSDDEENLD